MTVERWPPVRGDAAPDLRLAMLADAVTGGCDAGVQFSLRGATTRVYLDLLQEPATFAGCSVLVTHSRGDAPEEAERRVQQACDWIAASGAKLGYKKIDSTLSGNVGPELEAIRNRFPDRLILVSPSFPNMDSESHLRAIAKAAVQIVPQPLLVGSVGLAAPWSELLLKAVDSGANGAREEASLVPPVSAASATVLVAGLVVFCIGSNVKAIQLGTEILPGLPWGTLVGGPADLLPICTKAGGFGNTEALCQAVNFLASQPRSPGGTP